jgi:hypothetical protein
MKIGLKQQDLQQKQQQSTQQVKQDNKKLAMEKYKVDKQEQIAKANRNEKPKPPKK